MTPAPSGRRRTRGQSLVEFALVLPIMLLLTMTALDLGRVYLGYINIQNMARIAANFAAENPDAWTGSGDTAVQGQYRNQLINDATAINCALPVVGGAPAVPTPVFTDQTGNGAANNLGDTVAVGVSCNFAIITPVISNVIGTNGILPVSASAVFPVKAAMTGTSGAILLAPVAAFSGTPTAGTDPLTVQFTDESTNGPTSWSWDFESDGTADSSATNPTHTYTAGVYTVKLTATNSAGSGTSTRAFYISVSSPPIIVDFTATPASGPKTLTVQFTDTSTTTPAAPTAWAWDFDDDGTTDSTLQNPTNAYPIVGTYTVKLTATYPTGPASKTYPNLINVSVPTCKVPKFSQTSSSTAQATWVAAGFTTTVQFQQGGLPWTIASQNQVVAQVIPCDSPITVSKN